ncbi:MAG TPA: hypothetical protein VMV86_01775, partial [Methanosarcinales archaeon]|nr:hypothetical protein [Methanosarcinales archaeon]
MKKLIILIVLLAGISLFAQTNKIIREQDLEARLGDSLATGGGAGLTQPLDTLEVTNDASIGGNLDVDGRIYTLGLGLRQNRATTGNVFNQLSNTVGDVYWG